jgi:ribosome biogenesis protein BMS1
VAATGVTLDINQKFNIVKKLKLTGYPHQIYKNTAMIRDMFNSQLEVAKFIGAKIRTVSGIRGQIKKALRTPPGGFRATFEDRILNSDIVFIRTWFTIDVPTYYNPVTSLLAADKSQWEGMRLIREVRREQHLPVPQNPDSSYREVQRQLRAPVPIKIPKALQSELPFASKPKLQPKRETKSLQAARAVVLEPKQKEVLTVLRELSTIKNSKLREKATKEKAHRQKIEQQIREQEERRLKKIKEERRQMIKKQRRT